MYNLGVLLIFHTYFSGKNVVRHYKVAWAPTPMLVFYLRQRMLCFQFGLFVCLWVCLSVG